MFVFVQVTVNPTIQSNPFVITDSIIFTTNGNIQNVKLVAWGQNAHFFASQAVCNQVWGANFDTIKPYVIYNSILVPAGCTLTIEPGTKIYSHPGSEILVQGTINALGQKLIRYSSRATGWSSFTALRRANGTVLSSLRGALVIHSLTAL